MKISIGPYPAKQGKERKISVEIHDYDTWNVDSTLALIIAPLLKNLKEKSHVYTFVDACDAPGDIVGCKERRNFVLDEMIWGFEQMQSRCLFDDDEEQRLENSLRLFAKYYRNFWT